MQSDTLMEAASLQCSLSALIPLTIYVALNAAQQAIILDLDWFYDGITHVRGQNFEYAEYRFHL